VRDYYVYILTNSAGVLYVGMTNDLGNRLWQHVHDRGPGFVSTHNLDRLVFYHIYHAPRDAIAREKLIKGWRRSKKTALIHTLNPSWRDLSGRFPYAIPGSVSRQARDDGSGVVTSLWLVSLGEIISFGSMPPPHR
jgi:putative endonuclease